MKIAILVLLMSVLSCAGIVHAQESEPETVITRAEAPSADAIALTVVADGFSRPLFLTHAGDGSDRIFVLEQTGKILVLKDGERAEFPFLDISALITQTADRPYSEQGLLGLAFHPEFPSNGVFFVNYTDRRGTTIVASYQVSLSNPDIADINSGQIIFQLRSLMPTTTAATSNSVPMAIYMSVWETADRPMIRSAPGKTASSCSAPS